jgi:hypothetical protein
MISISRIARRPVRFARSLVLAKRENERLKQELGQSRRRLKRTRRLLQESRQHLKMAAQQYERLEDTNARVTQRTRQASRAYLLCRMPKGSVCAEIGVHEGEFSRQILDEVEPQRLHLIDPWKQEQEVMDARYAKVMERVAEEIASGRVQVHRNPSSEVHEAFEDSYFDWVYVDGNRLYEYVKQDLELYYPKVKAGGYLTGDDYGVRGFWGNGVQKAVDEFVSRTPGVTLKVQGTQFIIKKEALR